MTVNTDLHRRASDTPAWNTFKRFWVHAYHAYMKKLKGLAKMEIGITESDEVVLEAEDRPKLVGLLCKS